MKTYLRHSHPEQLTEVRPVLRPAFYILDVLTHRTAPLCEPLCCQDDQHHSQAFRHHEEGPGRNVCLRTFAPRFSTQPPDVTYGDLTAIGVTASGRGISRAPHPPSTAARGLGSLELGVPAMVVSPIAGAAPDRMTGVVISRHRAPSGQA